MSDAEYAAAEEGEDDMITVAAIYVAKGGCYYGLPDVDPWDAERDARLYAGPHPVVAHPPCERWGRYWSGGPLAKVRRVRGDDGGCFAAALEAVRRWGGVLEHPEASSAWRAFGLIGPRRGGWEVAGDGVGWTCCVDQGQYGHRATKATWLYAASCELSSLNWARARGRVRLELLSKGQRLATPTPFRDLLLAIARTARDGAGESAARPAACAAAGDAAWAAAGDATRDAQLAALSQLLLEAP